MAGSVPSGSYVNGALAIATSSTSSVLSSGKRFTPDGALLTTTTVESLFLVNGFPLVEIGYVFTVPKGSDVAPSIVRGGLTFDNSGALVTVTAALATAPLFISNGVTVDASGALVTA